MCKERLETRFHPRHRSDLRVTTPSRFSGSVQPAEPIVAWPARSVGWNFALQQLGE